MKIIDKKYLIIKTLSEGSYGKVVLACRLKD